MEQVSTLITQGETCRTEPNRFIWMGQNLTDAIAGRWGSYLYRDLVHGWDYVNDTEELWFVDHDQSGIFTLPNETSTYHQWNSVLYYDNWATPHMAIHNDLDHRLPVSEGIIMFNMLQVKGVPSKFLNFPDENHWILNKENSLVWHEEVLKWINYYSGLSDASPF